MMMVMKSCRLALSSDVFLPPLKRPRNMFVCLCARGRRGTSPPDDKVKAQKQCQEQEESYSNAYCGTGLNTPTAGISSRYTVRSFKFVVGRDIHDRE